VAAVNAGFAPAGGEIEWARSVLAAVASAGAGAVRLGGEMIDRPIIERAHAILRESGEE
jgi:citrate lyase subunit beta/citryl-CoA lyase